MSKLSKGFKSFWDGLRANLLWEYWLAFKNTAWEVFWGASVLGILFGIYTLFYAPSKILLLSYSLVVAFIAGCYIWRADHLRLQPAFAVT